MLRRSGVRVSKGADAAEVAKLLAQRKKNWVDRRKHGVKAGGNTRNPVDERPVCELCQRRFMFLEDYMAHKESEQHQDRLRWVELESWYTLTGTKMVADRDEVQWREFYDAVVKPEAEYTGRPVDEVAAEHKRGRVAATAETGARADLPEVKVTITEPRDNRWPSSPKH